MAATPRQLKFTHDDYTVGWICALSNELAAAWAMLDDEHQLLPAASPQDDNCYFFGRIGNHNVVIACLPAEQTGKVSAAKVAKDMIRSFKAIRFGFMVGIGGGAPYYGTRNNSDTKCRETEDEKSEEIIDPESIQDIRLGDVVISLHSKSTEAVVQYDFGKSEQEKEFIHIGGKLNRPPDVILTAINNLKAQHTVKDHSIPEILSIAGSKNWRMKKKIQYPGSEMDQLFKSNVIHIDGNKSCKTCCGPLNVNLVKRPDRNDSAPKLHYGTIGSADQVMKDAILRDKWSQKEKILCFEMEAAGLDSFPCIIIRGICDYADSHKTKIWQNYAAATAAAYAKELLLTIAGQDIVGLSPIEQNVRPLVDARQYHVYHVYHGPWRDEVEKEEEEGEETEGPSRKRRRISLGAKDKDEDEDGDGDGDEYGNDYEEDEDEDEDEEDEDDGEDEEGEEGKFFRVSESEDSSSSTSSRRKIASRARARANFNESDDESNSDGEGHEDEDEDEGSDYFL